MIKKILACCIALIPAAAAAQKTSVLFLGNSYTYVNNLPQTFHDLALSKGDTVVFDSNAQGSYRFLDHLADATSLSKINQQPWNYVVLQDQSQWPSFPPAQVASGVYPYAKRLDSLIVLNNTCTETVFYMTWGRKNGDTSNCAGYPPVCTFNGMNARLRESYLQMAMDNHATTSPVAVAWKNVRDAFPAINLYQADESHPTLQGTYLAACVFYATLFHKSPVGATIPAGVLATEGLQLQTVAAATVLDSLSNWQQYGDIPNAAFSFSVTGTQAQFTNLSDNASIYQWQFGDNTSSTQANPVHTYTSAVMPYVSLNASNTCKNFTTADTVALQSVATVISAHRNDNLLTILPNPASDQLTIENKTNQATHLKIINTLGKTIFYKENISADEKINIREWPCGVYYIIATSDNMSIVKKIIKN
jgi:hypothetical protein